MEKFLTVEEIAEVLQVSKRTIYDWTHIGYIPHYKFRRQVRFKESTVNKWLRRREKSGRNEFNLNVDILEKV